MNKQQLLEFRQRVEQQKEREEQTGSLLTCAPGFSQAYYQRPGMARRRALVALFQQFPSARLPVNNRWQANTVDSDLRQLLKQGVLVQIRGGGRKLHPMNKSSGKRQSYLVLANMWHVCIRS